MPMPSHLSFHNPSPAFPRCEEDGTTLYAISVGSDVAWYRCRARTYKSYFRFVREVEPAELEALADAEDEDYVEDDEDYVEDDEDEGDASSETGSAASESDAEAYAESVRHRIEQLRDHTRAYKRAKEALAVLVMAQSHFPCDLHAQALEAVMRLYAAGSERITAALADAGLSEDEGDDEE